jgi:hypothetical protein
MSGGWCKTRDVGAAVADLRRICDAGARSGHTLGTLSERLVLTMAAWFVRPRSHTGVSGGVNHARRFDPLEPGRPGARRPDVCSHVGVHQAGAKRGAACHTPAWVDCQAACSSRYPTGSLASEWGLRSCWRPRHVGRNSGLAVERLRDCFGEPVPGPREHQSRVNCFDHTIEATADVAHQRVTAREDRR